MIVSKLFRHGMHALGALALAATIATPIALPTAAHAQSQSINGTIRGRIADPSGAAIGNAAVTITNPTVGYNKTINASSDGYYVVINLPLGEYTVAISSPGFSSLTVQKVTLNAGTEAVVDGNLKVGGSDSSINVVATESTIDPTNLNVQRTLDSREVENLPLTSRNPYNFILFQPGVSGHPNPELGIPRTINTNGLLDRINYQMDGMINTEADRIGLRLFPIGNVFVKEVQTVSNSFAPEYGWTTGDVYNVISNSGTNQYHGSFQYIRRWVDATAYPLLSAPGSVKPNLQLNDYAANFGAPAIKDKLFYFGSYEHVVRGTPAPVTITPANIAALGLAPDQVVPAPGLLHGTFVDVRTDYNINKKNSVFARYNYFQNKFPFNTQVGGLNATSTNADFVDRAHVFGIQLVTTINDHLLNELRVSSPFRSNAHTPTFPNSGPAVVITGVANIGGSSNAGDQYNDKQPSGSDNVSYIRGRQTFKAGFVLAQLENKQRTVSFNQYTFPNLAAYLSAKSGASPSSYSLFSSQTDLNGVNYASLFYGGYVQDTWQVSPKLVAVFGVRYDRFKSPNANANALYPDSRNFNVPNTNFAPRLGFAYRASDTTTIKVSGGIFYQQTPTNLWFNALNQDGSNRTSSYSYSPTQKGAPVFPNVPPSTGTAPVQNVTTVNPAFKNEYTWNFNAQLAQQLSSKTSLTIGGIASNGRNLMYQHNINLINPIGNLADGRPVFSSVICAASTTPTANCPSNGQATRANPNFNQVNRVESGANSSFNALFASFVLNPTRGLQLNANYTWSHTISDANEVNTFEQNAGLSDTTNRKRDRGNSLVNRPNAFNLTAVLEPQSNFTNRFAKEIADHNRIALLFNLSSGDQGNILAAPGNVNGDASTGATGRPAFVGRYSARSNSIYQIDGRYTRTFPEIYHHLDLSFLLEANNLLNHPNINGLAITQPVQLFVPGGTAAQNANAGVAVGAPTISRSTVLESRIVQFGFAARF